MGTPHVERQVEEVMREFERRRNAQGTMAEDFEFRVLRHLDSCHRRLAVAAVQSFPAAVVRDDGITFALKQVEISTRARLGSSVRACVTELLRIIASGDLPAKLQYEPGQPTHADQSSTTVPAAAGHAPLLFGLGLVAGAIVQALAHRLSSGR